MSNKKIWNLKVNEGVDCVKSAHTHTHTQRIAECTMIRALAYEINAWNKKVFRSTARMGMIDWKWRRKTSKWSKWKPKCEFLWKEFSLFLILILDCFCLVTSAKMIRKWKQMKRKCDQREVNEWCKWLKVIREECSRCVGVPNSAKSNVWANDGRSPSSADWTRPYTNGRTKNEQNEKGRSKRRAM